MVGVSSIIAICITLFITLVLPLIVYVIYGIKNKGEGVWLAWLLGAAGFFVMQVIIRLPILSIVSIIPGFQTFAMENYLIYSLVLAFTAALFEVIARFGVAKIMQKNLTYMKSFAAGLGHGSIEAMVIIGMTYINNLLYAVMINTGTFDGIVEQTAALGVDITSLLAIKESLINTGAGMFYLAAYERILTVICHIAMTMIVCYFVSRKQDIKGIIICLLCHWALDFIAPVINGMSTEYLGNVLSQTTAYVIIYVFLTAAAVAAVMVIRNLKARKVEE